MSRRSTARSLASLGQTTLSSRQRLNNADVHNPELIMAGLWADLNKQEPGTTDILPVQHIAHQCTDKCKGGEHSYRVLETKDVEIISATVQWLATTAGRAFYTKFLQELGVAIEYRPDAAAARKADRDKKHGTK